VLQTPFRTLSPGNGTRIRAGTPMTFVWTPSGGNYTWHLRGPGGNPNIGTGSNNFYNRTAPQTPGTYTWYVDSDGQTTPTSRFTVF
jgi:hypothetical protein